MTVSATEDNVTEDVRFDDKCLSIYSILHETQRYEREGIWNRLNIMLTTNTVLIAVISLLCTIRPDNWKPITLVVAVAGLLQCVWSVYVLRRLWLWHEHWIKEIQKIEETFPSCYPKTLSKPPVSTIKSEKWYQSWLTSYTQPFMIILAGMWIAVIVCVAFSV